MLLPVIVIFAIPLSFAENNVCLTYEDYFNIDRSENCYHSPYLYKNVSEIAEIYAGASETHEVTTEDGYILTIFRVPRDNPKGVLLLHHPLLTDANMWVNQENDSTAFYFWNAGYDVWLPSNRGSKYCQKHVNLTNKDPKFWNYSFHEIGLYDHKAAIDRIKNVTGVDKVIFLSHSMGGTSGLIYASLRPEHASSSVQLMIHMAPMAYAKYSTSLMRLPALLEPLVETITNFLQIGPAIHYNTTFLKIIRPIVIEQPFKRIISIAISLTCGWTPDQYDPRFVNPMASEFPSDVSLKTLYHFLQIFRAGGRFQLYDYGLGNLEEYGSIIPPEYPLEDITTPQFVVHSKDDTLSTPGDIDFLMQKLRENVRYGALEVDGLNHVDFQYGQDRIEKVYSKILNVISSF